MSSDLVFARRNLPRRATFEVTGVKVWVLSRGHVIGMNSICARLVGGIETERLYDGVTYDVLLVKEACVAQLIEVCSQLCSPRSLRDTSSNAVSERYLVIAFKLEMARTSLPLLTWWGVLVSKLARCVYLTGWCHKRVMVWRLHIIFVFSLKLGWEFVICMFSSHLVWWTASHIFTRCCLTFLWCLHHPSTHWVYRHCSWTPLKVFFHFFVSFTLDRCLLICVSSITMHVLIMKPQSFSSTMIYWCRRLIKVINDNPHLLVIMLESHMLFNKGVHVYNVKVAWSKDLVSVNSTFCAVWSSSKFT